MESIKNNKEEVISSLELEDYLNAYINDADNSLKEKIIMSNFLNKYMDKGLYVVELFRDKGFYIRVENDKDEIVSGELFLGVEVTKEETKNIDKNIEHYELLTNTDMTINKFVENVLNDKEISAEDKIFMIRDFIKHLNKGLYRQDAEDQFGNMCQLVMDQNTHEIIDKIYY